MLAMESSARDREPSLAARAAAASRLRTHGPGAADRAEVEAFIRAVYRERYGADVNQFAPVLVSLADEHGDVIAAAGYRAGDRGPLFLERYLAAPIETYLVEGPSVLPERSRLVEVGHLAATRAGPAEQPRGRFALGGELVLAPVPAAVVQRRPHGRVRRREKACRATSIRPASTTGRWS